MAGEETEITAFNGWIAYACTVGLISNPSVLDAIPSRNVPRLAVEHRRRIPLVPPQALKYSTLARGADIPVCQNCRSRLPSAIALYDPTPVGNAAL